MGAALRRAVGETLWPAYRAEGSARRSNPRSCLCPGKASVSRKKEGWAANEHTADFGPLHCRSRTRDELVLAEQGHPACRTHYGVAVHLLHASHPFHRRLSHRYRIGRFALIGPHGGWHGAEYLLERGRAGEMGNRVPVSCLGIGGAG